MPSFTPEVIPVFEKAAGIRAFFTTRKGGVSRGSFESLNLSYFSGDAPANVDRNWELLLRSQDLENMPVTRPRLCHGVGIEEITSASDPSPENTDAIYTGEENHVLAVTMGDCLAALIADPEMRCIAVVHAGWRGTRDAILEKTLEHLFSTNRSRRSSTLIALGPCLSLESLEVSGEVARGLSAMHIHENQGRFFFDMKNCNRDQALKAGVPPENISQIGGCTRKDPDRFFSYRRDGAASGRMAACIALI